MFDDLLNQQQRDRKGKTFANSGTDDAARCLDLDWYRAYASPISYRINQMGFRDIDHDFLEGKMFVIGDSFTMGIGQPYEETWPCLLEKLTGEAIVKLAVDGASNEWICTVFDRIVNLQPSVIFVMLSFAHRKLSMSSNGAEHLHYDETLSYSPSWIEDISSRTIHCFDRMTQVSQKHEIPIFFSAVPEFDCMKPLPEIRKSLVPYRRFTSSSPFSVFKKFDDLARDGFHFGKKTCKEIAENLYIRYRESNR